MLLAGDEMGNSQGGNNNAYCQDSEISWIKWDRTDEPAGVREVLVGVAAPASGVPPAALLPRPADPRHRGQGHRLAEPGRARAAGRGLELRRRPARWASCSAATPASCSTRRRPAGARRRLHRPDERLPRADTLHPAAGRDGQALGGRARHRRRQGAGPAPRGRQRVSARAALARRPHRRALVERLREAAAPPAEERPSLEDVPEAAPPAATSESLRRERELAEVGEGS